MDLTRLLAPRRVAHAHCDIPCGVYDPAQARIEAESCYRIIEKYHASEDPLFRARCIHVKEERAELTKHHIDVMWHDYFKPEHVEKYPDLHDVCWKASKQASQVKRTLDVAEAQKLLDLIDRIDQMWKATGSASSQSPGSSVGVMLAPSTATRPRHERAIRRGPPSIRDQAVSMPVRPGRASDRPPSRRVAVRPACASSTARPWPSTSRRSCR